MTGDQAKDVEAALNELRSQGDQFREEISKELAEKRSELSEQLDEPLQRLNKIARPE